MVAVDWWKSHHTRGAAVGTAFGMVLILVLGWLWGPGSKAGSDPELVPCGDRVAIKVISSTEKYEAIKQLADSYNKAALRPSGATCAEVTVEDVSSGIAELLLVDPKVKDPAVTDDDRIKVRGAQVWAPSSTLWQDRLALDTDSDRLKSLGSLARSPMVLAMHEKLARSSFGDLKTWDEAIELLRDQTVKYTQEDPRGSTSGSMATFLTFDAAALADERKSSLNPKTLNTGHISDNKIREYVQGVQRAAESGYVNDSTEILRGWARNGAPEDTMVIIQEQMVWAYNDGVYSPNREKPEVPLKAVYPATKLNNRKAESLFTDHPYVLLPDSTKEQQGAAEDFFSYVTRETTTLCQQGFRAPEGSSAKSCPLPESASSTKWIDLKKEIQPLNLPTVDVQKAIHEAWRSLKSPRRILIAMDVSGSMEGDKLKDANSAIREAAKELRADDEVEIWQFAGARDEKTYRWKIRSMGKVGNQPTFPELNVLPGKEKKKQTAFFPTVKAAYEEMSGAPQQEPAGNIVNAVIIVSDGVHDWSGPEESVDSVCRGWKDTTVTRAPAVHTIYYTPRPGEYEPEEVEAGRQAMEQLATCNGKTTGSAQDGSTPGAMTQAFSQIMRAL